MSSSEIVLVLFIIAILCLMVCIPMLVSIILLKEENNELKNKIDNNML